MKNYENLSELERLLLPQIVPPLILGAVVIVLLLFCGRLSPETLTVLIGGLFAWICSNLIHFGRSSDVSSSLNTRTKSPFRDHNQEGQAYDHD